MINSILNLNNSVNDSINRIYKFPNNSLENLQTTSHIRYNVHMNTQMMCYFGVAFNAWLINNISNFNYLVDGDSDNITIIRKNEDD